MADGQHGGYRTPSNPAPVSGPGAHAQRTDRGPKQHEITGGSYGSSQEFQQQQAGASLSPAPGGPGSTPAPTPATPPTPFGAGSENPDEPVTAGANAGAGPSAVEAGIESQTDDELKQRLGPLVPTLMRMADSSTATTVFKEQVRQLIARIS